jgi:hypothetical protein
MIFWALLDEEDEEIEENEDPIVECGLFTSKRLPTPRDG